MVPNPSRDPCSSAKRASLSAAPLDMDRFISSHLCASLYAFTSFALLLLLLLFAPLPPPPKEGSQPPAPPPRNEFSPPLAEDEDDDDDDDSALPEWAVAVLVLVTWRVRFWRCRICRWLSEMLDSESPRNLARKEDTTLKGSFSLEDKICITWKGGRILSRSISFKKSPSKSYASSSSSSSPHSLIAAFVDKLPTSTPPTPPPSPPVEQPPVSWVVVECLKAAAAYSSLSSTNSQRATKCPNTFAHKFGLGLASAFDCRRHTRITSSNSPAKKWPSTSSSVKFSSPPPPPLLPPSLPPPPPPLPPAAADADATDIAAEGAGGPSWLLLIFSKRKC
mmetsp:Transcript_57365/g.107927  ORF Transcript_57365/g.107927 Transcript_57365/m.107927 type:complete len:335 (-) Transcript_57365:171-1175(-)